MSKIKDRRIAKSEKAIQTAFLEMLLDVGFDAITVKEMTEKADISRKTFYLHYLDKYDLLNGIVDEMIRELTDLCEKKKEMGFVEGTVLWFYYFEDHKPFFTALFSTEVLRKFMGMAVLGVIESYVLDQFHAGIEEISKQVGELLEQIIVRAQSEENVK